MSEERDFRMWRSEWGDWGARERPQKAQWVTQSQPLVQFPDEAVQRVLSATPFNLYQPHKPRDFVWSYCNVASCRRDAFKRRACPCSGSWLKKEREILTLHSPAHKRAEGSLTKHFFKRKITGALNCSPVRFFFYFFFGEFLQLSPS